jgi:hypothetical protein
LGKDPAPGKSLEGEGKRDASHPLDGGLSAIGLVLSTGTVVSAIVGVELSLGRGDDLAI